MTSDGFGKRFEVEFAETCTEMPLVSMVDAKDIKVIFYLLKIEVFLHFQKLRSPTKKGGGQWRCKHEHISRCFNYNRKFAVVLINGSHLSVLQFPIMFKLEANSNKLRI